MSLALLHYMNNNKEMVITTLNSCFSINPGLKSIFRYYPKLGLGFDNEFVAEILGS